MAVEFDYDVLWFEDRDIMAGVTRTHLVLAPGESVMLELEYDGPESIEEIDYAIHNLDYAHD